MSAECPHYILDSFALLAYLNVEPGFQKVKQLLIQAKSEKANLLISIINIGEIAYIVERKQGIEDAQQVIAALWQLPITVLPADQKAVLAAAHVKANYSISYADAFVAAAAIEHDAPILTGDPEFKRLGDLVEISALT